MMAHEQIAATKSALETLQQAILDCYKQQNPTFTGDMLSPRDLEPEEKALFEPLLKHHTDLQARVKRLEKAIIPKQQRIDAVAHAEEEIKRLKAAYDAAPLQKHVLLTAQAEDINRNSQQQRAVLEGQRTRAMLEAARSIARRGAEKQAVIDEYSELRKALQPKRTESEKQRQQQQRWQKVCRAREASRQRMQQIIALDEVIKTSPRKIRALSKALKPKQKQLEKLNQAIQPKLKQLKGIAAMAKDTKALVKTLSQAETAEDKSDAKANLKHHLTECRNSFNPRGYTGFALFWRVAAMVGLGVLGGILGAIAGGVFGTALSPAGTGLGAMFGGAKGLSIGMGVGAGLVGLSFSGLSGLRFFKKSTKKTTETDFVKTSVKGKENLQWHSERSWLANVYVNLTIYLARTEPKRRGTRRASTTHREAAKTLANKIYKGLKAIFPTPESNISAEPTEAAAATPLQSLGGVTRTAPVDAFMSAYRDVTLTSEQYTSLKRLEAQLKQDLDPKKAGISHRGGLFGQRSFLYALMTHATDDQRGALPKYNKKLVVAEENVTGLGVF